MFDPLFSDPPLLPASPKYLLIEQRLGASCTCSLWCVLREMVFFFSLEMHVISTGPISTVQTEGQG
ncbi:unnamed protein product, partial [Staurois parvus]